MKKIFVLLMSVLIMFSVASTFSHANIVDNASEMVQITFAKDASVDQVNAFIAGNNVVVKSFLAVADIDHSSGYIVVNEADFETLWLDFLIKQEALLKEAIESNYSEQVIADLQIMLSALENNDLQISVEFRNPIGTISNYWYSSDIVENVQISDFNVDADISSAEKIDAEASYLSTSASNWLPTSGWARAWNSTQISDATFMEVLYCWDSASELSTLTDDSDSILEGDLVFYNYDGSAIATEWYDDNYTYTTNQPRPYLDTQFLDNEEEPVFCIGCSDASSLVAGTNYYWIGYGNQTGSSGCKAKLYFQRGHRAISSLYEQSWNIFADETVIVIPFSEWNTTNNDIAYFEN